MRIWKENGRYEEVKRDSLELSVWILEVVA